MKSLITTLLTIGVIAPISAHAFSLDGIFEAAKNGNGTYTESHSSVSTGGQTAGSGESVQTNDASASSYTEIRADNSGGEVKVKIETTKNGETKTEEYSKSIDPKKGVRMETSASVKNSESKSEVKVDGELQEATPPAEVSPPVAAAFSSKVSLLFTEKIPHFFKLALNFFSWF